MERSLSFGAAAEEYERLRPGYSEDLVAVVTSMAAQPIRTAIEIGAGTGKATRMFAAAGIEVTAVEPDPAMLAVLERECAGLPVHPVLGAYEDLDHDQLGPYDLLFAAAAWHWTRRDGRWDRAAAMVRPGGLVAFFGGPLEVADPEVAELEASVLRRNQIEAGVQPPRVAGTPGVAGMNWPGDELLADHRFTDVTQRQICRRLVMDRRSYLGHLNTISAYRVLPVATRSAVLDELARILPDEIPLSADLDVHTAHRVDEAPDAEFAG